MLLHLFLLLFLLLIGASGTPTAPLLRSLVVVVVVVVVVHIASFILDLILLLTTVMLLPLSIGRVMIVPLHGTRITHLRDNKEQSGGGQSSIIWYMAINYPHSSYEA